MTVPTTFMKRGTPDYPAAQRTAIRAATLVGAFLAAVVCGPVTAVAEGFPPVKLYFKNGGTLTFYGNISKGILSFDDGISTESYSIIDNDNATTSFGLSYEQAVGNGTVSGILDFNYAPYSTANVNILDPSPGADSFRISDDDWNQIQLVFKSGTYGTFSLGQGPMATYSAAEVDLSGTSVIAYSEIMDTAAGQLFRFSDPSLPYPDNVSPVSVGDAFANFDGDQFVRLRYDTPTYSGFGASFAVGQNLLTGTSETRDDTIADVAINYFGGDDIWTYKAAGGYLYNEGGADNFVVSGSVLHKPTGLNLTFAGGSSDGEYGTGNYLYSKIGLTRSFFSWGATSAAIDYYSGSDIYLSSAVTDSDSQSSSISIVQNIDRANLSIYATYRVYDYQDDTASYYDGHAVFAGLTFTF
jgi:hypothetical protein